MLFTLVQMSSGVLFNVNWSTKKRYQTHRGSKRKEKERREKNVRRKTKDRTILDFGGPVAPTCFISGLRMYPIILQPLEFVLLFNYTFKLILPSFCLCAGSCNMNVAFRTSG